MSSENTDATTTTPHQAAAPETEGGDHGGIILADMKRKQQLGPQSPNPSSKKIRVQTQTTQQLLVDRCQVLKMLPPKDENGRVADEEDVIYRYKMDRYDVYLNPEYVHDEEERLDNERILIFLYGRNFHSNDELTRKREVKHILEDATSRRDTMDIINLHGDVPLSGPEQLNTNNLLMKYANSYGINDDDGINIFFTHGSKWVQRVQKSGNCFIHAPIVGQSYVLQSEDTQVIDISKYARNALTSSQLSQHLVQHKGGDSSAVFNHVLSGKVTERVSKEDFFMTEDDGDYGIDPGSCYLAQCLKNYGAGVVTGFRLDHRFRGTKHQKEGDNTIRVPYLDGQLEPLGKNEEPAFHSLVLVGMKKVKGEWRLLLQNWWEQLQLVEVSQSYIVSSGASVIFSKFKQKSTPQNFDRCDHVYAEAKFEGSDLREIVCDA